MASKHFTSSSGQAQVQPRDTDTQNFGNQIYQYERGKLEVKISGNIINYLVNLRILYKSKV